MAAMRLLCHIVGEADLLLPASRGLSEDVRADRISARLDQLTEVMKSDPAGPAAARDRLRKPSWDELSASTPSPLIGALDWISLRDERDPRKDLDVVLIATSQSPPDPLDTLPIAQTLATILGPDPTGEAPVRRVSVITANDLREHAVSQALTRHLASAPSYQDALMTWGSGSTGLAMGGLTALSQAGIRWRLLHTSDPAAYTITDPLGSPTTDPVVNVLIRWRMFTALAELADEDPAAVELTPEQLRLIRAAADRHRTGFTTRDCAALRAVVADSVVRRDGTTSLAVRQYVTAYYDELFAADRKRQPQAVNLLQKFGGDRQPLGGKLRKAKDQSDPDVRASFSLCSYQWLTGRIAEALNEIGKGSHTLCLPPPKEAGIVGKHLAAHHPDGQGWEEAGLLRPPVVPASTVLVVWLAGTAVPSGAVPLSVQLTEQELPAPVRAHVGVDTPRIRAVVFGVGDSVPRAENEVAQLLYAEQEAHLELLPEDSTAVEAAIARHLTPDVAAVLFVPTGRKPHLLALLQAVRQLSASHGIPLFVRQNAHPKKGKPYDVHLWPALVGGDRPLLVAARQALQMLELDVAWRLLAASAIDRKIVDDARRLADRFASRLDPDTPPGVINTFAQRLTCGMVNQRLKLVATVLEQPGRENADVIRLLVLAADVMEASIAATQVGGQPGEKYRQLRKKWQQLAEGDTAYARAARILLLLNETRNRAPVTHGTNPRPKGMIDEAMGRLRNKRYLPGPTDLPTDAPSLLEATIAAAEELGLGQKDQVNDLMHWHRRLVDRVTEVLDTRV